MFFYFGVFFRGYLSMKSWDNGYILVVYEFYLLNIVGNRVKD